MYQNNVFLRKNTNVLMIYANLLVNIMVNNCIQLLICCNKSITVSPNAQTIYEDYVPGLPRIIAEVLL